MALSVKKGTVALTGIAGTDLTISGLSDPKAIIVWGTYQTAVGITSLVDLRWGIGFGTYRGSVVQQCYVSAWSDDGNTTTTYAESFNTDALLRGLSAAGTVDFEIDLVSMDATSVVIDIADVPTTASIVLHYLILGGDDILDAQAHSFALGTAVATQDVALASGMGNPDTSSGWLSFFAKAQRTATGQAAGDIGICIGVDDGTNSFANLFGSDTALGNVAAAHWQKTGRSILGFTGTAGTADCEANIDSTGHPADGYQLAFADQATVACQVAALAIRGTFQTTVGETATRTATGDQDIAAGFTPVGAFLTGGNVTQKTTIDTSASALGAQWAGGTDFTTEGSSGYHENDGLGFSDIVMWHNTTQALEIRRPDVAENSDVLLCVADASVSGTDLRLNYTTVDATARGFCYLILGSEAAGGGGTRIKDLIGMQVIPEKR